MHLGCCSLQALPEPAVLAVVWADIDIVCADLETVAIVEVAVAGTVVDRHAVAIQLAPMR